MRRGAAAVVGPGEQCPQHQEAERERQAVGRGAHGGQRGGVCGLRLAAAWAQGAPLSLARPRWSGWHSTGMFSSLALTRCTNFPGSRSRGAVRRVRGAAGGAWRRELSGERGRERVRVPRTWSLGDCDMMN